MQFCHENYNIKNLNTSYYNKYTSSTMNNETKSINIAFISYTMMKINLEKTWNSGCYHQITLLQNCGSA